MKTFHLKIITPEGILIDTEVQKVIAPTTSGEVTLLADHVNMMTVLATGELRYISAEGEEIPFALSSGFIEVTSQEKDGAYSTEANILASTALRVEDIDVQEAEEAIKRAKEKLQNIEDAEQYADISGKMEREISKLRIANKYKRISSYSKNSSQDIL